VTEQLQREFFNCIEGRKKDRFGWLTAVYSGAASRR